MSDRPLHDRGSKKLLEIARQAHASGNRMVLREVERILKGRDKLSATKALGVLREFGAPAGRARAKGTPTLDARAPCLYAIKLRPNDKAAYYIGSSDAHRAACKASLHIRGDCICGVTDDPKPQQARLPNKYGIALARARELPTGIDTCARVEEEKAWAQELANELGVVTWCDGRAYEPRRTASRRSAASTRRSPTR